MTQPIQHIASNTPTTAASRADSGASDHLSDQEQKTKFSLYLPENYPLSDILEKIREHLTEDEYLVVESWLTNGETLPLWEEFAGKLLPFLAGNNDLLSPQIRERLQQLALQMPNAGQLPHAEKSWQELKDFFQQLVSQPNSINSTTTETESLAATQAQIDLRNPSLSFVPTALGMSLQEDGSAGINMLASISSTGTDAVRSTSLASTGTIATSTQPAASILSVPLGEPGWNQALGRQIRWMIGSEIQTASLKITPPQLGPIEINLLVRNDQADIRFVAQQDQVREVLEAAIPRLREMFKDSSLDLVNVDVGKKEMGSHDQFSALVSDHSAEGEQRSDGYADTQDSVEFAGNAENNLVFF